MNCSLAGLRVLLGCAIPGFLVLAAIWSAGQEQGAPDPGEPGKEKGSQYAKNVSPSGVALGLLPSHIDGGGLPEEVRRYAELGAAASTEKNWRKAREAYRKMVELAPRNALAYANLGVTEYQLENFEAARVALNRSLHLNPTIAQNWMTLGLIYHKEENLEMAISCLARAIHEDPKDPRTHLYMAIAAYDYGWGTAAETELQRAIQLDPTYADAHFNLALMYLEKEPPAVELARRHYYMAVDSGAKPDLSVEKQLKYMAEKNTGRGESKSESGE